MGGLIFYYISDTHNIQKRQTEINTQREIVLHYTVFMFTFENEIFYYCKISYRVLNAYANFIN